MDLYIKYIEEHITNQHFFCVVHSIYGQEITIYFDKGNWKIKDNKLWNITDDIIKELYLYKVDLEEFETILLQTMLTEGYFYYKMKFNYDKLKHILRLISKENIREQVVLFDQFKESLQNLIFESTKKADQSKNKLKIVK